MNFCRILQSVVLLFLTVFLSSSGCKKERLAAPGAPSGAAVWLTTGDESQLLKKLPPLSFSNANSSPLVVDIDTAKRFQQVDGFGYCLTGGSAVLLNALPATERKKLLQELFGRGENSVGISYLRVSIGASDLDSTVFSYDNMPEGQIDPSLTRFSIQPDRPNLIPVLKEILSINPAIKILGSPWSPPAWMKTNGLTKGGSLKPEFYPVYANYFAKYIQAMKAEGITIDAITPQNEPLHPGNNPSLYMSAEEQAAFIKNHLGPVLRQAGLQTKIIVYDHNLDKPDYPITILNDTGAKQFVDGSAFHLYAGDVNALAQVHDAHPDRNLYFTEQWTGAKGTFAVDLRWHVKNVIIGTMRNWCRVALEWNLANDPNFGPHTPGGCTECKGALTIDPAGVHRNVSYYIVAHASKFVPAGSVRIASNVAGTIHNVAFKTPENNIVLIAVNDSDTATDFSIRFGNSFANASLPAGAVGTYVWK